MIYYRKTRYYLYKGWHNERFDITVRRIVKTTVFVRSGSIYLFPTTIGQFGPTIISLVPIRIVGWRLSV